MNRVASGVILVALIAGCRQLVGIGDREVAVADDAGIDAAPAVWRDAPCGDCVERACAAELAACANDPACAKAQACFARCDPVDEKCRSACRLDELAGLTTEMAALQSCQTQRCSSACRFACGGYVASSASCASCFAAQCCDAARACNESAGCLTRRFCRQRCVDDQVCRSGCNFSDGMQEDDALRGCQSKLCPAECTPWSCVGASPPFVTVSSIKVTLRVLTPTQTFGVVGGLRVRRCEATDTTCAFPAGEGFTSQETGAVELDVPLTNGAWAGYFEITDPAGTWVDEIVTPHPPLGADARLDVRGVSKSLRDSYARAVGASLRDDRGLVLVHALDCARADAAGLRFALSSGTDGETVEFYLRDVVAVRAADGTSMTQQGQAYGGFFDVKPGSVILTGTSQRVPPLAVFDRSIQIHAGKITYVDYSPAR
ncbi:MAG: hypothetical protein KF819_37180 [Labilithrix sp.]|nr:hypothetical protein [Labilithrix sp.]